MIAIFSVLLRHNGDPLGPRRKLTAVHGYVIVIAAKVCVLRHQKMRPTLKSMFFFFTFTCISKQL
jgi:hypothetical protein